MTPRVAAIVPLYPPQSRVGAWIATHELLRALVERGAQVRVLPFLAGRARPYVFDGVSVEPGVTRAELARWADVLVSHPGTARAVDALAHLRTSTPSVRVCHGLTFDPSRLDGSALVIANSQTTAARVRDSYDGPLRVCRPPLDYARIRVPRPGDKVTVVNLSAAKGGELFWQLAGRMPDVEFLACRGGYGQQIERRRSNVTVVGPVRDVRVVYAETRLLLLPTLNESWGLTGVEAITSGIPVLARRLPGLVESLGRAATFPDDDSSPASWEAALRRLLTPRAYRGAAARARRRARELDYDEDRATFADAVLAVAERRQLT